MDFDERPVASIMHRYLHVFVATPACPHRLNGATRKCRVDFPIFPTNRIA